MLDGYRLHRREGEQRFESFFAPVPRMLHPAERQLNAAARAVGVDEHLAGANRARQA